MSKRYYCDRCDREIYQGNKLSITTNEKIVGFNIIQGDEFHDGERVEMKNFMRLDYCDINCLVRHATGGKYSAIETSQK